MKTLPFAQRVRDRHCRLLRLDQGDPKLAPAAAVWAADTDEKPCPLEQVTDDRCPARRARHVHRRPHR